LFFKSFNPIRRIKGLAQELRRALEQRDQALQDKQRLESENARLREQIEHLQKELHGAARGSASGGLRFREASARVTRNPQGARRSYKEYFNI